VRFSPPVPRIRFCLVLFATLGVSLLGFGQAQALLRLDFEQKFFTHPHRQVWDFSMVRPDSIYHIFYHTIHEQTPNATYGDTIWHATSENLRNWQIEGPILTVGPEPHDSGAMWAPDVFWDPDAQNWKILYTGNDAQMNQSICLAESPDLYTWAKSPHNPVIEPDPEQYVWSRDGWWSNFRDPFVWREDGQWHVLVTALQFMGENTGVLYHGVSTDLINWTDVGILYHNDGEEPWRVPESPQLHQINDYYWLFFGEFDTGGLSVISSRQPTRFTMDDREVFDYGYAPEIDEFDPGVHIVSRLSPYQNSIIDGISYPVRIDTVQFNFDGTPDVQKPHPLDYNWAVRNGIACLAAPTFGDNPAFRGDPTVGMVGNSYFGSAEYFQGPLSGRGSPGVQLGDGARGELHSHAFVVTGDYIELLVGGGDYAQTCYVALVDAATDEILLSETGGGEVTMTPRVWNVRPYQGMTCYIAIKDDETGEMGHINVDEIIEIVAPLSAVQTPDARLALRDAQAAPNPFNPSTRVRFILDEPMAVQLRIHDLRGRVIWTGARQSLEAGARSIAWQGRDSRGHSVPAGNYLFSLEAGGRVAASGKLSLVK